MALLKRLAQEAFSARRRRWRRAREYDECASWGGPSTKTDDGCGVVVLAVKFVFVESSWVRLLPGMTVPAGV